MEFEWTEQVVSAELTFKKKKVKILKRKFNDERRKVDVYNCHSTKCNFSGFFCYFGISLCSHFVQAPKAMRILSSRLIKLSVESSSG